VKIGVVLPMGSHGGPPDPWLQLRAFALRAETVGLDSLWVFDHLIFRFEDQPERGVLEAWTVLSALAEATSRVELGSLVLGLRLRNPGLLAKMAVTLDELSGERLTLGVGAGWHDPEYEAFGYPLDHRLGRTEEALGLLMDLLREGRASASGEWVQARDAAMLPPATRRIPVLGAARGGRMMRIVARHADAFNAAWVARPSDPVLVQRMADFTAACHEVGRDPASVARTVGVSVRYPDAELAGPSPDPSKNLSGTPVEIAVGLRAFADAGYAHLMIWLEPMTVASLDRLAESVALLRAG
jgi:alkanesulfonate monooxygenase SsuD/methylene tetrahydromethanopterin reductase-like flavin-dependent oxidoreductase (luciferase family)